MATTGNSSNGKQSKPKLSNKKKGKHVTPWWQTTPFVASVTIIGLSIVLMFEPFASYVDQFLGTTGSTPPAMPPRSLQQQQTSSGTMTEAADQLCEDQGGCSPAPSSIHESFEVSLINNSPYRADIYWDNGRMGQKVTDIEANGARQKLKVFAENTFFITRHGVKEGLFDPTTDVQHKFTTTKQGQTFIIPQNAAPSTNACQDRFQGTCENYARQGKCWDTPGWMIVHCCKSCEQYSPDLQARRLIDSKVRCSRDNMNITGPGVWEPGDLDKLFTKWASAPEFQQYQPNVLSSPDGLFTSDNKEGPWVMTFDNFFSAEEAAALIMGGEMAGFDRSTNQGAMNALGEQERVTSTTRTSSNAWCMGKCDQLPEVQALTSRIEQVTGIPRKNYEPFQVLEYQDNQFYKMHHDSEGRDSRPPGNRILTFFLYLSDVEEGGETQFNKLGIHVTPKRGRALVWPSVLNDEPDFWDERMYHEAMPVIKGKKYAANHWIHLYDYEGPNKWGCTGSFA